MAHKPFPWKCAQCGAEKVYRTTMPYTCEVLRQGKLIVVTVPSLEVPQCRECGELVFDNHADDQIQNALSTKG